MKSCLIFIITLICVWPLFTEDMPVFENLIDPQFIHLTDTALIIADQTKIHLYSPKDFKLIKSFGKQGSGPQEFLPLPGGRWIIPTVQQDYIFIESLGKISYFKPDGRFIREIPNGQRGFGFKGIKDKMVAFQRAPVGGKLFDTFKIFDDHAQPQTELFKQPNRQQRGREIHLLTGSNLLEVSESEIFLAASLKMEVRIFNLKGELTQHIKHDYPRPRKVLPADVQGVHKFMRQKYPGQYPRIKNLIRLPETFPVLRSRIGLKYDSNRGEGRLYLLTWKQTAGKSEFYIFSTRGELIKKVFLPLADKDFVQPYPFTFKDNRLYQLVYDEESEQYKLHVQDVK